MSQNPDSVQIPKKWLAIGGAAVLALLLAGVLILLTRDSDDGSTAATPVIGLGVPTTAATPVNDQPEPTATTPGVAATVATTSTAAADDSPTVAIDNLIIPKPRDRAIPMEGRVIGDVNAPVRIIEFADFQCPACGTFAREMEPTLVEDYIKTGKVVMVFHDFPFLDDRSGTGESDRASEAAACAADQNYFWDYHDMLFHNQRGENDESFSDARLQAFAQAISGLDYDTWNSCYTARTHRDVVQERYNQAIQFGVNSTPSFLVNESGVRGANWEQLQSVIDSELEKAATAEQEALDAPVAPPTPRDPAVARDGRGIGDPNAPVKVVSYADYQCPACGMFARDMEPRLMEEYVKTGLVYYSFHDLPFLDDRSGTGESDRAAEAAMCAQDQNLFWAFHDVLFYNQKGDGRPGFTDARLQVLARAIEGLDMDTWQTCYESRVHFAAVQEMARTAQDAGIDATPSFDVNGTIVRGADYGELKKAIDAALGR